MVNGKHARKKIATIEKWRASGLSQAEFCRREGIQQWQLSSWKRFVEVLEDQVDDTPSGTVAGANGKALGASNGRTEAKQGKSRQDRADVQPQSFVPVRLVDPAEEDREERSTFTFDCVLEIVLKRGQTIRVASSCEPRFLSAVVSALNL